MEDKTDENATHDLPSHNKEAKMSRTIEYDIEMSEEGRIFAVSSFFKDFNDIREYLHTVWTDYCKGKLDIMSAAVTTDTALGTNRGLFSIF